MQKIQDIKRKVDNGGVGLNKDDMEYLFTKIEVAEQLLRTLRPHCAYANLIAPFEEFFKDEDGEA